MTAAYDALSPERKKRLHGIKAVNSYLYTYEKKATYFKLRPKLAERGTDWLPPDVVHDVIRTHPYTGQKCLYVNEGYTTRIIGLPDGESDALLDELKAHAVQPQFQYAHKWAVGDLVMWDNCLTRTRRRRITHCRSGDCSNARRCWALPISACWHDARAAARRLTTAVS